MKSLDDEIAEIKTNILSDAKRGKADMVRCYQDRFRLLEIVDELRKENSALKNENYERRKNHSWVNDD